MSPSSNVYVGIWADLSKVVLARYILTLPVRDGNILISILSLFIQIVGGQSWSIWCFVIHQLRTTKEAKDGLHHQQQVILRNNTTDGGTSWQLARISWAWRTYTTHSIRRTLGFVLFGVTHLLLFGAAGVLSSHIVTVGNEVLLAESPSCGRWFQPFISNETDFVTAVNWNQYQQNNVELSSQYVHSCLNESQSSPECNTFKQPQLNWTSVTNAACPFEDNLCLGPLNSSLQLTTAFIDSRDDLGINGDDAHRMQYRKTATCSPLETNGYFMHGNNTFDGVTYLYSAAFYGPNFALDSSLPSNGGIPNATYVHSHVSQAAVPYDTVTGSPYYIVSPWTSYPTTPGGNFLPVPALFSPNWTVTLVFVSFTGSYAGPSDDLWVSAHRFANSTNVLGDNSTFIIPQYFIDKDVSVLACTEQHQFCNPNPSTNATHKCTPFLAIDQFIFDNLFGGEELVSIIDNEVQFEIASIIHTAAYNSKFDSIIQQLNPPILAAEIATQGASPQLPSNQWILEAENWFSIGLNNIQRLVVDAATGPPGYGSQYTAGQADEDASLKTICKSQIIRRADFTSFSVLAISLIFAFGILVMSISLSMESAMEWFRRRYEKGRYLQVRWVLDSKLQLQRMAYEEAGLGTWKGGMDEVPVTDIGEQFTVVQNWEDVHPKIGPKWSENLGREKSFEVQDGSFF